MWPAGCAGALSTEDRAAVPAAAAEPPGGHVAAGMGCMAVAPLRGPMLPGGCVPVAGGVAAPKTWLRAPDPTVPAKPGSCALLNAGPVALGPDNAALGRAPKRAVVLVGPRLSAGNGGTEAMPGAKADAAPPEGSGSTGKGRVEPEVILRSDPDESGATPIEEDRREEVESVMLISQGPLR